MHRDAIRDAVQEIWCDVVEVDGVGIIDDPLAEDAADWDSTNHVRLMGAIEQEFNIRFETVEINKPESAPELVYPIANKKILSIESALASLELNESVLNVRRRELNRKGGRQARGGRPDIAL